MADRPSQETARAWIERWDIQQQDHLPHREERFTAMIDAVEEFAGRPDPLVLDLGCGPGSLSVRLLARLPQASVVAVDADPLLLTLGRAAWDGLPGLSFATADLRSGDLAGALALERRPDAAVSTTALHWLPQAALENLYRQLAALLRPGGLFLDGDHMRADPVAEPVLDRLDRALDERADRRMSPAGQAETWTSWWDAARTDPELGPLVARRASLGLEAEHHGSPAGRLSVQVAALRAAGFAEVGTLWQHGNNRILCGVLPG